METFSKSFVIQWVGPFKSRVQLIEYENNAETCDRELFSFYYIEGRFYHRRKNKLYSYLGKTEQAYISKRVNNGHEHFQFFDIDEATNIWIGSFGDPKDINHENTHLVETLLIYANASSLTENTQQTKNPPSSSIAITNLWYRKNSDTLYQRRPASAPMLSDVIIYESESGCLKTGMISTKEWEK